MNRLSLQAINESSSYDVTEVGEGCYQFFTDNGVHCMVEFVLDDSLMSRETYHLLSMSITKSRQVTRRYVTQ
jgi:hypothetical protein